MFRNLVLASAALIIAGSAQAVTFTSTAFDTTGTSKVFDDFESSVKGVKLSGSYTINAKDLSGVRASPAGDDTKYFATPGSKDPTPGTATIDFAKYLGKSRSFETFSFYWGSIDTYNTLTLLGTGLTGQTVFTGSDITTPANGDQGAALTNRTVTFAFGKGEKLTGIKLDSSSRAFEIDNLAGTVPEPATWAMLLVGFGMVGAASRARGRAVAA